MLKKLKILYFNNLVKLIIVNKDNIDFYILYRLLLNLHNNDDELSFIRKYSKSGINIWFRIKKVYPFWSNKDIINQYENILYCDLNSVNIFLSDRCELHYNYKLVNSIKYEDTNKISINYLKNRFKNKIRNEKI